MIKHVGLHNNKKIVLLFREVPEEDHMCLVAYSELLPRLIHDEVMKVLESPSGQQAKNLSDALFTHIMPDGRNCLESLHKNGLIKKVATNAVKITPNKNSSIMLSELNTILNEMEKGEEAIKRLKDLDKPTKVQKQNTNQKNSPNELDIITTTESILTDEDLAAQRIDQAKRMRADAARLLSEAENLEKEAESLIPKLNDQSKKKTTKVKKS